VTRNVATATIPKARITEPFILWPPWLAAARRLDPRGTVER
jgi:hypothetical protein